MAWLGQPAPRLERTLDVIVGGQYGSEGKGNVCAHLAENYDCLVRIGGPNAGHRVADPKYKYVQFPSGSKSNPNAKMQTVPFWSVLELLHRSSHVGMPRLPHCFVVCL